MFKIQLVRVSFLECDTANLFQDSQIVAYRLDSQSSFNDDILLKFPYEQFVELAEGKVGHLELAFDEISKTATGIKIVRECAVGHVYSHTRPDFLDMPVKEFEQGHLGVHTALKRILDRHSIKLLLTFQQSIKCRIDGKQQFFNFGIGFHRLLALAVQTAFTGIPQFGRA